MDDARQGEAVGGDAARAAHAAIEDRVVVGRRSGTDRVHVDHTCGETLGYLDRETGAVHVYDPEQREAVEAALEAYEASRPI